MGKRRRVPDRRKVHDNQTEAKILRLDQDAKRNHDSECDKGSLTGSVNISQKNLSKNAEWNLWGPYLSERQWGTVREDISEDGTCWESFPHSQAGSRCYQYGEDGLFGWSDDQAELCVSLGLWNSKDPVIKERLFGMTGPQGNHGEDVKECYYYLDSTPNHSYMKALYKYPINEFPYDNLLEVNTSRTAEDPEYEVDDTGVFEEKEYFDVYCKCIKNSSRDMLFEYTVYNRSNRQAQIDVLPQIWFRNTWANDSEKEKPKIQALGDNGVLCVHQRLGKYIFEYDTSSGEPEKLFTENETNFKDLDKETRTLLQQQQTGPITKIQHGFRDAFQQYLVHGNIPALNSFARGTKFGVHYNYALLPGCKAVIKCRLVYEPEAKPLGFGQVFDNIVLKAEKENISFYKEILPKNLSYDEQLIATQAYAGLCWNKQYFGYDLLKWIKAGRRNINLDWRHMVNSDVISMPDKWEFPWYATWDLAFHMIPFSEIDTNFAKDQLLLFLNQRYIHPNGQLPAYEFDFSDVNPPVHAMACLHVFRADRDVNFLKKCFNKLMLNFNWWMNSKQIGQSFLFGGGFLGMDNESCLHRSKLPEGCQLYQVDGSCWMAYYSLCMMQIALELCTTEEAYIDMVIMYLDYFLSIAHAVNFGLEGKGLWDEEDCFFYDVLKINHQSKDTTTKLKAAKVKQSKLKTLRVRAMIGLSTLFPVCTISYELLEAMPELKSRVAELTKLRAPIVSMLELEWNSKQSLFLSLLPRSRLDSVMKYMCKEEEFLSPYGIRSLSKYHKDHPFSVEVLGEVHTVEYNPGESQCDMFGGNSNWRGPIWFPMNYLIIESLEKLGEHYGHIATYPYTLSSKLTPLVSQKDFGDIAHDLCRRLVSIFLPDQKGRRPCHGNQSLYTKDDHFKDLNLFYEYFDCDTGRGCGASHQTGWTALVVTLLRKLKGQ